MIQRHTIAAGALVLVGVGAAFLVWETSRAHAGESTHDEIERLMPQLMSDDDGLRTEAERRVFDLDAPGRDELDKIARGADTRRAITALRLLDRRMWSGDRRPNSAEQHSAAAGGAGPSAAIVAQPAAGLPEPVRDEIADLRHRVEECERSLPSDTRLDWPKGAEIRAKASGELAENDRKITWSIAEDGSVKVTTKDGKDTSERSYEANSLAELQTNAPEVAKRLDDALPRAERGLVVHLAPPDADALLGWILPGGRWMDPRVPPNVAPPVLGIEWSRPSDALRDQLGVPGGMVVQSVVAGTPAEKLGVQRHDLLIELNGRSVAGSADIHAVLDPMKPGEKLAAVVVRKGRRQTLSAVR